MQDIRVVALDLDGTVFDDAKTISPRNAAAINAALQKGVLVLPATGRPATGVPQQFLDWPGVDYAITSNGATVTELATGKKLVEQPISPALAIQLYDLLQPFGGLISVFVDGQSYSQTGNVDACNAFLPPNLRAYFHTTRGEVADLRQFMRDHAQEIEKFSIIYPDDAARDAAWQAVLTAGPTEITTSLDSNLEINAPGVTKGSALLALARHLGLARSQLMAMGDSGNDLAMLQAAGLGVAMGNATEEVKAAADAVSADNNHDGVAVAIEKYVL